MEFLTFDQILTKNIFGINREEVGWADNSDNSDISDHSDHSDISDKSDGADGADREGGGQVEGRIKKTARSGGSWPLCGLTVERRD